MTAGRRIGKVRMIRPARQGPAMGRRMNRKAGQDLVLAAVLAAISLFVLIDMGGSAGTNIVRGGEVTHTTLPMVYAAILLFLTLLLAVKAALQLRRPETGAPAFSMAPAVWLRIAGTLACLLGYVALLKTAPFIVLTAAFLALLFILYGHRRLLPIALVSIIGAVALDALFIRILHLPI